jgi:hypothetical protein
VISRRAATAVAFEAAAQRRQTIHSLDRAALERRYGPSVSALRRALAASPGDVWIHCQLVDALRCAQRLSECVGACDELISLRPRFAWGYRRRAWAHRHRFDIPAALRDVEHGLSLEPNPSTRGYRALLLGLLGEDAACQAEFAAVMSTDATLVEAFGLERALFWVMAEDYACALPWLRRRYRPGDDALRLYWLALAVARTRGLAAAGATVTAGRRASAALASTEARPLGEYLLAAFALLEGDGSGVAELLRCARLDPVLLELAVIDPLSRRSLAHDHFERLIEERFGGATQAPRFFEIWRAR